ncbi:hypothetical protein AB431_07550 [Mycobacterium sp. EPa45]|nr:hypothetical protein AB431_07550 [Mycobacterium sp. EPa45]
MTVGDGVPEASALNPLNSSPRFAPTITARCPNDVPVFANEYATSPGSVSGCSSRSRTSAAAWPAKAAADFADKAHGVMPAVMTISSRKPRWWCVT